MTAGERVKRIRKEKDLTLEKFGEKVGVTKQTISRIENGINSLTDQMVLSICREFSVNEEWLRNGTGEPFIQVTPYEKTHNRFGYIMENSSPSKKAALSVLLELLYSVPDDQWDMIMEQYNEIKKES